MSGNKKHEEKEKIYRELEQIGQRGIFVGGIWGGCIALSLGYILTKTCNFHFI